MVAARRDAPARVLMGAFPRRLRVPAASGGPLTVKVEVPAGFSGPPADWWGPAPRVVLRPGGVSAPWRRPAARVLAVSRPLERNPVIAAGQSERP